ncbi:MULTISPECIES: hypothetical protein [Pseudoalteromonas]|uniref:Uncharacterized protein n=2 Tax=Pseudoalteromonas TaxID=53246 RepID=V4HP47_PSEL2|nr:MULTISPECIES: hypothetical protein [Pseudoalteromonas]ESP91553.1 hypothetical protein PL2TA16_00352 [Pseudoalteromonas luteoviolacea 2ta16]KZN40200.1 hypothetical protein N483_18595 [Pseudoalteromonas luteoviolacea NCIMB 1944]MBQ4835679.1 hypothetical protein [Pseudoalteromonas luteoviolacea]MCG7549281.1 hypothetical protein [Pseudoalteromonas sp. Of7M-16]MDK2594067.1 hypothetical protein [Pseudoalteromonas sp. P94(2023)]
MIKSILAATALIVATSIPTNANAYEEILVECYKNGRLLWSDVFESYNESRTAEKICRRIGGEPISY